MTTRPFIHLSGHDIAVDAIDAIYGDVENQETQLLIRGMWLTVSEGPKAIHALIAEAQ